MKQLALTLPGGQAINAPAGVPTGGMSTSGASIVSSAIQILLLFAIVLALFYIIFGGIKWMTSGGEQEKIGSARQTIMFAIIGLCIAVLAFFIVTTIGNFFGPTTPLLNVPTTN